jgi:hypothetical protein
VKFAPLAPGLRLGAVLLSDNAVPGNPLLSVPAWGVGKAALVAFTPGTITTFAGTGTNNWVCNGDNIPATSAQLASPNALTLDAASNLYISDWQNYRIRKVTPGGTISTVAGNGEEGKGAENVQATSTPLWGSFGLAVDGAGNLYFSDWQAYRVRKVAPDGTVATFAGAKPTGLNGYNGDNIPALTAYLSPQRLAAGATGNLYISDECRLRSVDSQGMITTVAGDGICDNGGDSPDGMPGTAGYSGNGGPATGAELQVFGEAVDWRGNLYIADATNHVVRKVTPGGIISTVAGNGTTGYEGESGPATSVPLDGPFDISVDAAGDLYIVDVVRVLKVSPDGTISTVAGNGTTVSGGEGVPATSVGIFPKAVVSDASGNLYIADNENSTVHKVDVSTPPTLSFPVTKVGQISATQTVTLENHGSLPLAFNGIDVINAALDTSVTTCATAIPVMPGASCVLGIQFTPQTSGDLLTGSVTLTDNALNSMQKILLTGSATAPPTQLAFTMAPPSLLMANNNAGIVTVAVEDASGNPVASSNAPVTLTVTGTNGYSQSYGPASAVNGSVNFDLSAISLAIGSYTYTASSSGLTSAIAHQGVTASGGLQRTFTSLTVSSASSTPGQGVTLTATVTDGVSPSGTVVFVKGSVVLGQATLVNGTAQFSINTLQFGTHSLVAKYNGDAANAPSISDPAAVTVAGGIVAVTPGVISTIAGFWESDGSYSGDGGPASSAGLSYPYQLATDMAGNLYIADNGNNIVRKIDAKTGIISTVAGNASLGETYSGDGGPATSAGLYSPSVVAVDQAGNRFICDWGNGLIRRVDAISGVITTVAGNYLRRNSYFGDGGPATSAGLAYPDGIALDFAGNLYIADSLNVVIRKVDASTGIISTVAGNNSLQRNHGGDGGPATNAGLWYPTSIALDAANNLYIVDSANLIVRKVDARTGYISTIAGNPDNDGTEAYSGDGGPATAAGFAYPDAVAIDAAGNMYIVDAADNVVRKIDANTGLISTIAGKYAYRSPGYSGDGGPATNARVFSPEGIAIGPGGAIYIADSDNNVVRKVGPQGIMQFGSQATGTTSAEQTLTLNNIGNATITTSNISLTGDFQQGPSNSCFAITESHTKLIPAGSCTLSVEFSPTDTGASVGGESISFSDGEAVSVQLTGSVVGRASTTTTLLSSANPSSYGDSVTMTVNVASTSGKPSDLVDFTIKVMDGGLDLADSGLLNGSTSFPVATLRAGQHSLTAIYAGDSGYAGSTSATLVQTVNPAALTVTAANASRRYGDPNPQFTYTVSGFKNNESLGVVSGSAACTTTAQSTSAPGSYPITCSLGTLAAANYTFVFVLGTLTVTAAPLASSLLSVTVDQGAAPAYGTAISITAAVAQAQGQGFATGNLSYQLDNASPQKMSLSAYGSADIQLGVLAAGNHSIAVNYAGDPNYSSGTQTVAFVVNKGVLTAIADNKSMNYGTAPPTLSGTLTGVVTGDDITSSYSTLAMAASPVGQYPITVVLADPNNKISNYAVSNTSGTLTVGKVALTVVANNASTTYGAGLPSFSGTLTGVVAGDGISASYSTTATSSSPVGQYVVTATLADPNNKLTNYTVSNTPGALTIGKATPTINWATPAAITYGTPLSVAQLNATAPVPGTFAYLPVAGTVLGAGSQTLTATFTSTDTIDYSIATATVTLTVNSPPVITLQPTSQTVTLGNAATFTVTATGTPALTYSWQYFHAGAWHNWGVGTGFKTANFTTLATTANYNGLQFRVIVTDGNSLTATSNTVTLTVNSPPVITLQPTNQTVTLGNAATFTVAATGTPALTYSWQYFQAGAWHNWGVGTGFKTSTFTTLATNANYSGLQFRVIVTDGNGLTATSNTVTLTVNSPPVITLQPTNQTVTLGNAATFTVTATGTPALTYSWQYFQAGAWHNWGVGTGFKTANFTTLATTANYNGLQFRVIVTDGNSLTAISNTVTLTVQ